MTVAALKLITLTVLGLCRPGRAPRGVAHVNCAIDRAAAGLVFRQGSDGSWQK